MSSSVRKISTSEWEQHKDLIVELYRAKTLKDVRAEMQSQHSFEASPWQYEVQLKRWNIRKNATQKEWQQYFAANQNRPVTTSHDDSGKTLSPVILNKSTASKKRASRWAPGRLTNSINPQALQSTPPSNKPRPLARLVPNGPPEPETTMEAYIQDISLNLANAPGRLTNSPSSMDHLFSGMSAPCHVETYSDSSRASFHNVDELAQSLGLIPTSVPTHSSPVVLDSLSVFTGHDFTGRAIFASSGIAAENNMTFFSMLKETNFRRELPSAQLEHNLRSKGLVLDQVSGFTMLGGFAAKVVAGILSSNNQFITRRTPHLQHFLRELGSQVPGESSDLITNDQAFETKFVRILLFSILNGFAGLNDIPMENILRFLNRFVLNKLLLDVLEQCSRYTLRTLADNIFRASIEATDAKVLKLLLSRKLVDVNTTVCFHDGEKCTPVERAAALGSPKLVKSLIEAGADVNRAAKALLDGIEYQLSNETQSRIPHQSYETLKMLVSAGAQVHPKMMILDFRRRTLELDFLISQNIHPESHQDFFQNETGRTEEFVPVRHVAREFDDCRATKSIQKAIDLCHRHNCNKCVVSPGSSLRNAVVDAALTGKLETVQLLLEKADLNAKLSRIFGAAIKSGSRPLIDFILSLGPELDIPALGDGSDGFFLLTTPIAEAVRCGNVGLVRELEKSGCLDHINEGGRFEALVQAAAEAGNLPFMRNLLARAVTSKEAYRESGAALALALAGGHHDIVQMLLKAGATLSTQARHTSRNNVAQFLNEALDQRDIGMVHALIASGAHAAQILAHLSQADYSIMVGMAQEYPGFQLRREELQKLLPHFMKNNALEAFKDLLQHLVL